MNQRATGATTAVVSRIERLRAWMLHHRLVAVGSIRDLLQNPLASMMNWLMIGIALALPSILYMLLVNASELSGNWGGEPRVSIYLVEGVQRDAARKLTQQLASQAEVASSRFISRERSLRDFKQDSDFGDLLASLDHNPLPDAIEVTPLTRNPAELATLTERWRELDLVESVSVNLTWLERLFAILEFSERLVTALALVLGVGVVLVMGNTVRLAILNRRQEIEIVKLVGGTDAFVRRPFLYLGFWYGLGGALMAMLLTQLSILALAGPVANLAGSYGSSFTLTGPGFTGSLIILATGVLLGMTGAILAVSRHLGEVEPG